MDTGFIVDALQSREPFCKDVQLIFLLCANRQFEGFLTAKTIMDIYDLTHSDKVYKVCSGPITCCSRRSLPASGTGRSAHVLALSGGA